MGIETVFIGATIGATVGGITSAISGGDFIKGALGGAFMGGIGGLIGGTLAPAVSAGETASVASGTAVNLFGREISKQLLYSGIAGAGMGYLKGRQIGAEAQAIRKVREQQAQLKHNEDILQKRMTEQRDAYDKQMRAMTDGSNKELSVYLKNRRNREDANVAFWKHIDEFDNANLSDVLGGYYGEKELEAITA